MNGLTYQGSACKQDAGLKTPAKKPRMMGSHSLEALEQINAQYLQADMGSRQLGRRDRHAKMGQHPTNFMTGGPNMKQKDAHTIVTMQNQLYQ